MKRAFNVFGFPTTTYRRRTFSPSKSILGEAALPVTP